MEPVGNADVKNLKHFLKLSNLNFTNDFSEHLEILLKIIKNTLIRENSNILLIISVIVLE